MTPWLYKGEIFTPEMIDKHVGMVYMITDLTNDKKYIGKKLFTASKTVQKNKKKRRTRVESNWQEYTGSSETLNEQIDNGVDIRREILYLCKSKGWMTYLETKEILVRDALLKDDYYNAWFHARVRGSHLK